MRIRHWSTLTLLILFSIGLATVSNAKYEKEVALGEPACSTGDGGGGGEPPDPCDPNNPTNQCDNYWYSGWKWKQSDAEAGIPYTIDIDTVPAGITVGLFKQMVDSSFQEWERHSRKIKFIRDPSQVIGGEAGLCSGCGGKFKDNINSIHFLNRIDAGFTDIKCYLDSSNNCIIYTDDPPNQPRNYKRIKEVDTVIDLSPDKPWTNGDEAGKWDLQSTITHEVGHWIKLNDLYGDGEAKLTMYGYPLENSTEQRTLGKGDIHGLKIAYDGFT